MDIHEALAIKARFAERKEHFNGRLGTVMEKTKAVKEVVNDVNSVKESYENLQTLLELFSSTR